MSWKPTDLSDCPYFQGTGTKTCSHHCQDEPVCQTNEPTGGWPSAPWCAECGYPGPLWHHAPTCSQHPEIQRLVEQSQPPAEEQR